MRTDELIVGLLAFMAFVAVVPAWVHYLGEFDPGQSSTMFLAAMVLPATAALFLTSWVKPELAGLVTGGFVFVGAMVLAPWWWEMIGMVSAQLVDHPLAQLSLRLAVPVIMLTFLVGLGRRRVEA